MRPAVWIATYVAVATLALTCHTVMGMKSQFNKDIDEDKLRKVRRAWGKLDATWLRDGMRRFTAVACRGCAPCRTGRRKRMRTGMRTPTSGRRRRNAL